MDNVKVITVGNGDGEVTWEQMCKMIDDVFNNQSVPENYGTISWVCRYGILEEALRTAHEKAAERGVPDYILPEQTEEYVIMYGDAERNMYIDQLDYDSLFYGFMVAAMNSDDGDILTGLSNVIQIVDMIKNGRGHIVHNVPAPNDLSNFTKLEVREHKPEESTADGITA